jgi:transposase-like protein
VKRGKRYNKLGTKQLYLCKNCERKFIQQDGFERMRHRKEDIARAIHLHERGLSLADVKDHLWQHDGVKVTRECIRYWIKKYSLFLKSGKSSGKTKIKRKATS